MNKSANLMAALGLCVFCAASVPAQSLEDVNQPQGTGVQMTLTHLSVNDQTLELGWKIKNNTDHDVWICDSASVYGLSDFEVFMGEDAQTLVIRRRFDLPIRGLLERVPTSRYVRLRAGEDRAESLSLATPVRPRRLFGAVQANADPEYASRLALEISFYNEDLPGLILHILEVGGKLGCAPESGKIDFRDAEIFESYFASFFIQGFFETRSDFSESVKEQTEQVILPYMQQSLKGEQVLRLTADGVSIPYKSDYPPLVEAEAPSGVTMALTRLDVNDTKFDLGWKIKNNTNHDIWICDGYIERFMDTDARTLVLRRRFNLSNEGTRWEFPFPRFRYSRLRPSQERIESLSHSLPVTPGTLFSPSQGNAKSAKRLTVEVGFYDEDLQALILDIAELAQKLNCDISLSSPLVASDNEGMELRRRFFAGPFIARGFYQESFDYFRNSVTSGGDEIITPYLLEMLHGEQVLRIEVGNVSIRYKSNYPPLAGQ